MHRSFTLLYLQGCWWWLVQNMRQYASHAGSRYVMIEVDIACRRVLYLFPLEPRGISLFLTLVRRT